jgi:adenylate kinase
MGEVVILIGPTGAGKTAQGERLSAAYGWTHLSSGELLRHDPKLAAQLASGALTASYDVERVVEAAVRGVSKDETIILDGFPRLLDEAEWLTSRLSEWGRPLRFVILLVITAQVSEVRLKLRGREDDSPEAQSMKWHEYADETRPVLTYYEKVGLLVRIDGIGSEEEVYSRIKKVFSL